MRHQAHCYFGSSIGVVSLISFHRENVGLKLVIGDMFMTVFSVMWIRTQIQLITKKKVIMFDS